MSECVPLVKSGRDGRREALIPHATTTFSDRCPARDRNVSVHRAVLGTTDYRAEVNVRACRVKPDCDAQPCSEWNGGSARWEATTHYCKGGGAGYVKPLRARTLAYVARARRLAVGSHLL